MPKTTDKNSAGKVTERQRRIFDFINHNRTGVLATVDPDGEPHGSVIYHTIDERFNVSFLTKSDTKKYDNLSNDNHVMLVIFEPASQTVAQVIGEVIEVKDNYALNAIAASIFMASLKASPAGLPPVAKLTKGEYKAFRISPDQIRMASYARPDTDGYNIFESIESFELVKDGD